MSIPIHRQKNLMAKNETTWAHNPIWSGFKEHFWAACAKERRRIGKQLIMGGGGHTLKINITSCQIYICPKLTYMNTILNQKDIVKSWWISIKSCCVLFRHCWHVKVAVIRTVNLHLWILEYQIQWADFCQVYTTRRSCFVCKKHFFS